MKTPFRQALLVSTVIAATGSFMSINAHAAPCATTGNIAASCELQASTTGDITVNNGQTLTVDGNITIGDAIDGAAADGDGILLTSGNGIAVDQTGGIGTNFKPASLTIAAGDTWNAGNDIGVLNGFDVNGTLNIDGSSNSVVVNSNNTFITVGAGQTLTIQDTTNTVAVGLSHGVSLGAGATLAVNDGNDLFFGEIKGTAAGQGIFDLNDSYTLTSNVGTTNSLASVDIAAGQTLTTDSYGLSATAISVNAGSALSVTGSSTVTGAISLAAGAILSSADGSFILGDITGEGGVQTIQLLNGETLGQAGDEIDLAGGNDVITIDGGSTIGADTLDMGAGTDTMNVNNDTTITSDLLNTESVLIDDGIMLTVQGNMTGGTVTIGDTGNLTIDSAGNTVTSTVTGVTGSGEAQTLRMMDGTLLGAVNLGDGNDQVIFDAGTISNTVNMGAGTDSLTMNGNLTMTTAWSGLETANLNGNTLTVNTALTGVSDGFGTGVDVNGGTVNINGGGSIDGGIYSSNGAGDGNLVFGMNTLGGTFNLGGVVNDVGVTVTSGTVNTNGFSMGATELLGDIFIDTGAALAMTNDVSSGGNLINDGDIRIDTGDVLTAATTGAGTGTYTFVVNGAGAGDYGTLVVSGGAFDMSAATVDIDASAGSFTDGDEIMLVDSAASIIGGPGGTAAVLVENYFLWDFALVDGTGVTAATDDTDLFLIVSLAPGAAAIGGNNAGAAAALIALSGTGDPDLQDVLAQMNGAGSADEANEVFESVSPTVDAGQVTAVLDFGATTFDVVSTHLDGAEIAKAETPETGMAAGGAYKGMKVWGQTFAKQSDQSERDGVDGYESVGWGGIVGMETENIHDDALVGVAFGYGSTDVNSDNANRTGTDIDSYQGSVYGRYNFDEKQYVTAMAGYARSNLETTRYNVGTVPGLNAHGEFSADQYSASVEAGRKYKVSGFLLQPNVNSRWVHYAADGYSETGAGGAGLRVEESDLDQLTVGTGVDMAWGGEFDDGSYIIPGIHLGYKYDVIGDSIETTSAFNAGGPSFKTEGAEPARSTGNAGVSLTLMTGGGLEVRAAYDFEFKSDYEAHSGYIRASARF